MTGLITKTAQDAASSSSSCSSPRHSMDGTSKLSSPKSAFGKLRRKLSSRKTGKRSLSADSGTSKYCSELQRVFDYFDENGDGKISPAELQSCVTTVGSKLSMDEAEAAVKLSDLNGDGLLDFEEFQKLMETSGEEEDIALREAFAMYDMEGSGCITPKSLKRMLSRLGDSKSIENCRGMIRMYDLNGDGVLSFDEFRTMMR